LKVGIRVNRGTIQHYMRQIQHQPRCSIATIVGRPSWLITPPSFGRAISCRPTICSSAWSLSSSSSSWVRGGADPTPHSG